MTDHGPRNKGSVHSLSGYRCLLQGGHCILNQMLRYAKAAFDVADVGVLYIHRDCLDVRHGAVICYKLALTGSRW
jgi:hypothetical protein